MSGAFPGGAAYVRWGVVLDGYSWATQHWSVACWLRTSIAAGFGEIAGNTNFGAGVVGWELGVDGTTGRCIGQWAQSTAKRIVAYVGGAVNDGAWHHVAVVKAGGLWTDVSAWVDGVAGAVTNIAGGPMDGPSTTGLQLALGARSAGSSPLVGDVDDLAVYDRALSATEVRSLHTSRGGLLLPAGRVFAPDLNTVSVGATVVPRDRGPGKFTPTVTGAVVASAGPLRRIRRG